LICAGFQFIQPIGVIKRELLRQRRVSGLPHARASHLY
jgi:hypothetical protein